MRFSGSVTTVRKYTANASVLYAHELGLVPITTVVIVDLGRELCEHALCVTQVVDVRV
jgi:hypothetical protein